MWKGLASANACRNGVFAAMLAGDGVTGPDLSFEGKNGLIAQVTGPLELSALGRQPLRAGIVYLKSWPVFYSAQTSVQAALALKKIISVKEIKSITVASYKRLLGRGATDPEKWTPKSRETADHSVPFCVAAALLDGDITPATFDSRRFLDPEVIELMSKVQLREDPEFTKEYPLELSNHCRNFLGGAASSSCHLSKGASAKSIYRQRSRGKIPQVGRAPDRGGAVSIFSRLGLAPRGS